MKIIIGASSQAYEGWLRTQQDELDLVRREDWERLFSLASLDAILMEHVWEHLDPAQAVIAARNCFDFLAPGGYVRCAVTDGLFPDPEYQRTVQVGGPGPADHPAASHQVVYTWKTLPPVFVAAGFAVNLLEWWDDAVVFHEEPWDESDGFIYRSALFDHRNDRLNGVFGFTSLMIDARKPDLEGAPKADTESALSSRDAACGPTPCQQLHQPVRNTGLVHVSNQTISYIRGNRPAISA